MTDFLLSALTVMVIVLLMFVMVTIIIKDSPSETYCINGFIWDGATRSYTGETCELNFKG